MNLNKLEWVRISDTLFIVYMHERTEYRIAVFGRGSRKGTLAKPRIDQGYILHVARRQHRGTKIGDSLMASTNIYTIEGSPREQHRRIID